MTASVYIHKIPDATAGSRAVRTEKAKRLVVEYLETGFGSALQELCDYFSDRKDGVPYEDARKLHDFDDFHPHLLKGIPPFC